MSKNTSAIVELWSNFNIESVKRDLDEKVIEIAKLLEEGDDSRKRLIEQTKEFRKTLTDEQRKLVSQILKPFQSEVDMCSKRSKTMEQVLLNLYKQLIDLPDPLPALENLQRLQKKAERVQDLELENKMLKDTLDDFKLEFSQVKNQEPTIKLLKDRIKELEEKADIQIAAKLKEREKELQKSFADKEESMQTNQLDLVKKLGETEAKCLSLQSQLQKSQNELFELKAKQDELLNGKSLEIDLLMQDIDKLNERVTNSERLAEQYANKLAEQQSLKSESIVNEQQQEQMNYQNSTLEIELIAKEREIAQLVEDLQKLRLKSDKAREFYEKQRLQLEERLTSREKTVEQLELELRKKLDYDEIKKELNILKSIEFSEQYGTDASTSVSAAAAGLVTNAVGAPNEQQPLQKPLEVLLYEKNRHLMNENTQIKNKIAELQVKSDKLTAENLTLSNVNLEQKTLIVQLEKDLMKAINSKQSNGETNLESDLNLNQIINNSEERASISESSVSENVLQQASSEVDVSLFNIVSNQRERFRVRVQELESEILSNKQQNMFLTNEIDRLRSDNVKLYEKIKFLQSFSKNNTSTNESFLEGALENEDSNAIFNKYTNDYEKKLDPFGRFNYREKQKRYSNLKLHDKFTLNFGRFILSNKMARLIFFAYFLIIHLLIFGSLYFIAHRDASHRDFSAECAHSFKDHMKKVHGVETFEPPHQH